MAAAETARLIASLELQDKNFTRGIKNVERGIGRVDKKLGAFSGFLNRNLARGIDRAAASLVDGVFDGVRSLEKLEQAQAQTAAVLASTGQAAGINGAKVTELSEKYESLNAIVGDEFIRAGENMLLTFRNIKGEAFEPALEATLNLNTALGKGPEGLTATAIKVGKALNDPTKGLTALGRAGVQFTKAQVKKIKSLQKEGKLYEAQQIILKELNKEFGGSFAKQGDTTAGKVAKFNDAIEDLQRTFAKALLPIISKVADKLGTFLGDPAVVNAIEDAGIALGQAFDGMLAAAEKVNWGAIAGGLKAAAGFAGDLVGWFGKFPDWAQALIVGGFVATKLPIVGDIFSEAAKGLIKGVLGINAGVVNLKAASVVGGPGGIGGVAGGKKGPLGIGTGGGLILGALAVTLTGEAIALQQQISDRSTEQANTAQDSLTAMLAQKPNQEAIKTSLAAVQTGINQIQSNPLMVLVQGEALDKLKAMEAQLQANLTPTNPEKTSAHAGLRGGAPGKVPAQPINTKPIVTGLASIKASVTPLPAALRGAETQIGNVKSAVVTLDANQRAASVAAIATAVVGQIQQAAAATTAAINAAAAATAIRTGTANTTTAARVAGTTTAAAMSNAASRIVTAVNSLDLNVNVTTVNRTSTVNNRYGPSGGSSTTGRTPSSYHG